MRDEPLGPEVGAGLEVVDEFADELEVIGLVELGDGDGERDPVKVSLRGEGGGLADLDDAARVFLGLDEAKGGPGFLFGEEWCGRVLR